MIEILEHPELKITTHEITSKKYPYIKCTLPGKAYFNLLKIKDENNVLLSRQKLDRIRVTYENVTYDLYGCILIEKDNEKFLSVDDVKVIK